MSQHRSHEELEAELIRVHALLDKTQNQSKIAYWEYIPSTQETIWSDYVYQLLGYELHSIEPSNEIFDQSLHPEDREQFLKVRKKLAKEDLSAGFDFRIIVDGKIKYLKMTGVREIDAKGYVTRIIGTAQDVTDLKLNEDHLHNINHFASALMNLSSEHDLVWYVTKEVVSQLGLEDCVIYLIDQDQNPNTLVQSAAYGLKNTGEEHISNKIKIEVGEGISGHVAKTRTALIINDVSKDERYINDIPNMMGSEICVPIIHEGQLYGVIDCEHSTTNFFTEDHLGLLSTIATLLASKLGHWQYLKKIQASEIQYKDAQRIAHFGSWSWNFNTNVIYWSDEIYRILGLKPQEVEVTPAEFKKAIHPDDWLTVNKSIETATTGEKYYDIEFRVVRPNGDIRHVHALGEVSIDQDWIPFKISGSMMDITARVQAEESLRISQERLILQREQSPVGVIEWKPGFEILDWNPAAENIFGFTKDEVIGAHITERILPESARPMVEKVWKSLMENKGDIQSVNENTTKDGRAILCEWHSTPLIDGDGSVIGVTSLVSDITERHKTEESLRISQQRLLLHREQSPVGILEWNTKFEVAAWNPAAEHIFGYTKEEVMGKYILDWILPESARPVVDDIWEDLLENKGGTYSINENITKDGQTILCEWHNTPLVDDEGKVIGISVIVDDITEKQKKEENERQMLKMDAIGKLTGGIAHDFNNMLGVILGFSGLLKKSLDGDNPKQLKYCDQILKAGDRAKKLTSNLLEFSSTAPSSEETIDINKLLSDMEHMLETTFTARIQLTLELEEGLWPIYLDKARLEDAILNMGINAMHAMPDGGKLTMNSSTSHLVKKQSGKLGLSEGDYVVLSITDTGSGMPPEVQQKIFDPFFTTKGTEGTGLGLSQVYGFVQQAGGTIDVSSKIGYGTTLTLYFPRCTKDKVIETEDEAAAPVMLQQNDDTILVVDDEEALLLLNEDILAAAGYNVLLANGAEQALDVLKNNSVNLMLSDVIMPGVNGYQLAAEVEKLYPDVKIQMVSGFSEDHNKNVANNKLYQQRLHKPVDADTLLHRIAERLDIAE